LTAGKAKQRKEKKAALKIIASGHPNGWDSRGGLLKTAMAGKQPA
jgi:hypothetical protein